MLYISNAHSDLAKRHWQTERSRQEKQFYVDVLYMHIYTQLGRKEKSRENCRTAASAATLPAAGAIEECVAARYSCGLKENRNNNASQSKKNLHTLHVSLY